MKPIQTLLDELTKRITTTTSLIVELERNKNAVLAIENILFKYDITADALKIDNIVKINDQDYSNILEEMGEEDILTLTENFSKNKEIIKLYQEITSTHGNVAEAPQYNKAIEEIKKITFQISNYLTQFKNEQKGHISSLEEVLESYNKYANKFKIGELIEPIFDMNDFNDMLNKCGLDLTTKSAIKKEVGKLNYSLVINKGISKNENEKALDKYRVIVQRKKQEYGKTLEEVQEIFLSKNLIINIDNILIRIDEIANKIEKPYKIIQNAIVCLMLEKEINAYDKIILEQREITSEIKEEAIITCEKLLEISRMKPFKSTIENAKINEKEKETKKTKNAKMIKKDENIILIEKIQEIIIEETELLKSFSENDMSRLTEISNLYEKYVNEEESYEKNKLTLAYIAETLRLNLILFKQLLKNYNEDKKQYEIEYKNMVGDLREYLDTYDIVKKRVLEYKEKEQNALKK
ncbi:MAG: hypothetical protein PHD03_02855 [Bacilli bacterium]|nr:hypothetical protein [Bacilli bacterium]MDD4406507.1 hypothetical protein [Bacilli bacterium]